MKKYTTDKKCFVDSEGKKVVLRGINMVCKDKEKHYIGDYREEDFEFLAALGFNVVRFGIFWDAVEPEPGKYDDDYLSEISGFSKMAEKHGLALYLDMHQDLYSAEFCDGAPSWATLTDGNEYTPTELWSEAYLTCPAVSVAFDNFWNNKEAADGIGLQDHYAAMFTHIAEYFKDDDNIIGYDVLNEPFPGSVSGLLVQTLFCEIGAILSTDHIATEEEIMEAWMDNSKKVALLEKVSDKESYKGLVRPLSEPIAEFDRVSLSGFYQKMRDAIRRADPEALLFIEANYFCNTGVPSSVIPPKDADGKQDGLLVYSPHGYDLMVDTDMYSSDCFTRLDVIFEAHKEYADAHSLPTLVGEWGCYVDGNEAQQKEALYLLTKFSEYGFSNTYFDFSTIKGNRITKVFGKQ